MDFTTREDLKKEGFQGFKKIGDLFEDHHGISDEKGVYLVLYLDDQPPTFLKRGSGGSHKGKDPNVPISRLESNWVPDAIVIYIGQTGGKRGDKESNATLRGRLTTYLAFGRGKKAGHCGGRLIWQIENYRDLVICWKPTPDEDPKQIEEDLIQEFGRSYGKKPFANDPDEMR